MMMTRAQSYPLSIVASLMLVGAILIWRTDGFSSFTYESARRAAVVKRTTPVSDWQLEDTQSQNIRLSSFGEKLLVVDFIYTRCPTICRSLGSRYQQLQQLIGTEHQTGVTLLSVSIDPEFDTPNRLGLYRRANRGTVDTWRLARPSNPETLRSILAETGLRVIPDNFGGYSHSDSIHFIQNGVLSRIENWDSTAIEAIIRRGSTT